MALISAKTILTSLSLFHMTLGFFFLTNPATIAEQAIVWVLGEALGLPQAKVFETQSPALAFLGVILAILGVSDLVTLSLPEEISMLHHWAMQAPLRVSISFGLATYTFLFSDSSPLYSTQERAHIFSHPRPNTSSTDDMPFVPGAGWGGDALKNRLFFAFMFVESVSWLWAWVTLSEERKELAARVMAGRGAGAGDDYQRTSFAHYGNAALAPTPTRADQVRASPVMVGAEAAASAAAGVASPRRKSEARRRSFAPGGSGNYLHTD